MDEKLQQDKLKDMQEEKMYWVALSTHSKIGGRTFFKLYKRFRKLSRVWQARRADFLKAGLDSGQAEAVEEVISKKDPQKEAQRVEKFGLKVLTYPEKDYPKILKEIADPPGILYIKGDLKPEDEVALAVVGSRKYSPYGRRVTDLLVGPLANRGITIVSGLALGIDALAHEAALLAGGRTIAVLGCGLDQIYPISNIRLADKIVDKGAIISEFPLGMPALRYNFPIRNRIIAGLSLGTVVIECAEGSGSLLTAKSALEYNREVFAVPGSVFSETCAGTNRLIKMGAKPVLSFEDILEELEIEDQKESSRVREIIPDSKEEEILLRLLEKPVLLDKLTRKSGLEPAMVSSTLMMLEMKTKVTNLGGTRYVIRGKLKNF